MFSINLKYGHIVCAMIVLALFSACSTYYQKSELMLKAVNEGRYKDADNMLDKSAFEKKKRDILLYYLNRGAVNQMMQNYTESNKYFQQADFYIEDAHKNYGAFALGLLTNPSIEPYTGEGFEQILLHYYTTLNYLQLGQYDDALVECKRMQIKLQRITDAYGGKNAYKRDAFAHVLLGIIYDAQKNYNDAFIAYRNAIEIYEQDYATGLNTGIPDQLKKDVIRTAYLTGFNEEGKQFETKFNLTYQPPKDSTGSLVFFWNEGLGPVKDEWSINFYVVPGGGNMIYFENPELNLRFNYNAGGEDQKKSLSKLKVVRAAFPKYITRNPVYLKGHLINDSLKTDNVLELAEPINAIAYKSLNDRMLRELAEALARLAIKQLAEMEARKENEGLGAAVSILNAITEQADTRNWQLLPYSILYTRVELPQGKQSMSLNLSGNGISDTRKFDFNIRGNQTFFGYYGDFQFMGYSN